MVDIPKFITFISLKKQQCMTKAAHINLNPDKHINGLRYYLILVNLDRCNGSCNTSYNSHDTSSRICVPNKTEYVNLSVFNMINLLVENVAQIKSRIIMNVDVSAKIQENLMHGGKVIFGILVYARPRMGDI